MALNPAEMKAFQTLLSLAIAEDLEPTGDLTSKALLSEDQEGSAIVVAREKGVLAGVETAGRTFAVVAPQTSFTALKQDGEGLRPGDEIAKVQGKVRGMLSAERIALNFLQRLSGIATLAWKFSSLVADLPVKVLDTRKIAPGWRLLDKYAVRCGGGYNHRLNLSDGILIKDNHLAALGGGPPAVRKAVLLARQTYSGNWDVEVEVDDLASFDTALQTHPDVILLDNMSLEAMSLAVEKRNALAPGVQLEASGGVKLENLRHIALTGVDRISIGALTHSAPALDIALDYQFS
ncbi:MAG: carboxylating nicotinate-nucleotide diphosphorylase [Gemmataceae bacterium]|nr:carboxylating nicotinate-nucleotide diphosphorylase [Gemmataceae bacterium]